jgi:hypothetical protein
MSKPNSSFTEKTIPDGLKSWRRRWGDSRQLCRPKGQIKIVKMRIRGCHHLLKTRRQKLNRSKELGGQDDKS